MQTLCAEIERLRSHLERIRKVVEEQKGKDHEAAFHGSATYRPYELVRALLLHLHRVIEEGK